MKKFKRNSPARRSLEALVEREGTRQERMTFKSMIANNRGLSARLQSVSARLNNANEDLARIANQTPALYAIFDADGNVYMDEYCVDTNAAALTKYVQSMDEGYYVGPLFSNRLEVK